MIKHFCIALSFLLAAWTASEATPPYFEDLIKQGMVKIEYYDARNNPRRYPGRADFQINFHVNFRYQYTAGDDGRGKFWLVKPKFEPVKTASSHTVTLPNWLDNDRRWQHRLLKHEFDHIATSLDPRVTMLFEHILSKVTRIDTNIATNKKPSNDDINKLIDAEVSKRRKAVTDLVQANYLVLDKISRHGAIDVPKREAFFRSLYTKANLDYATFPYTADALDLVGKKEYLDVELPYAQ